VRERIFFWMKWRWVAAIVCTLYLGVGLVFAATHDHSGHSLAGDQGCAACAWHHDGQVDVPSAGLAVVAPQTAVLQFAATPISVFEISVGIHRSRGPPSIPQL
jgi:hypothetical protein